MAYRQQHWATSGQATGWGHSLTHQETGCLKTKEPASVSGFTPQHGPTPRTAKTWLVKQKNNSPTQARLYPGTRWALNTNRPTQPFRTPQVPCPIVLGTNDLKLPTVRLQELALPASSLALTPGTGFIFQQVGNSPRVFVTLILPTSEPALALGLLGLPQHKDPCCPLRGNPRTYSLGKERNTLLGCFLHKAKSRNVTNLPLTYKY